MQSWHPFDHVLFVQLLAPLEQTAALCGMEFLPPFVVHGVFMMSDEEIAGHAEDYRRVLEALHLGAIDLEAAKARRRLNASPFDELFEG